MADRLDLRLPSTMEAPGSARQALDDLASDLAPGVLDDVRLLVSELVTNSVRHAGLGEQGWVELRATLRGGTLRVEVGDPGPGFLPEIPQPTMYQESGWGLYLVEQVASRWGVVDRAGGLVWFEIDDATVRSGRPSRSSR
jgi:anti-sigma regulatory factor (Ser/Thr protein kinase)